MTHLHPMDPMGEGWPPVTLLVLVNCLWQMISQFGIIGFNEKAWKKKNKVLVILFVTMTMSLCNNFLSSG